MSLSGKRIVNTRAAHQAAEFDALLRGAGAIPLDYPCIAIAPPKDTSLLDRALTQDFDLLVLTSSNAVLVLAQRLAALGRSLAGAPAAAVGAATARAARNMLGVEIVQIPDDYAADTLAGALKVAPGARILLPQSEIAQPTLAQVLRQRGADVIAPVAYRTVRGSGGVDLPALLRAQQVDAVTFTSPSTVRHFVGRLANEGGTLPSVPVACIGARTSRAASEYGFTVVVEANPHSLDGLIAGLARYFRND
ncbi:MAG: uroporphyrinogen-III synthase [Anaerolineae bacterium]|nr:uroporphyrinogen-III synthase [Anaerolineae bacterium]